MRTLTLTTPQLIEAVYELDGERVPVRTLAYWAQIGIAPPSVQWAQQRGGGENKRLYNLSDLARVRLIVRLRGKGISMAVVRSMLAYLDAQLREVMKPKTTARLIVDGARAVIVRPDTPAVEVPSGQLRLELSLREVIDGNKQTAEKMTA